METREYNKELWGRGEWDNEPDRVDFQHAGFDCFILRNHSGVWCGYVGVPKGHPAYEIHYDDVNVDVHGGLTYCGLCEGTICHLPESGRPDDVWWLGFDCNHHMDLAPLTYFYVNRPNSGYTELDIHGTYKNVAYVTDEVKRLAEQLEKMKVD